MSSLWLKKYSLLYFTILPRHGQNYYEDFFLYINDMQFQVIKIRGMSKFCNAKKYQTSERLLSQ